MYTEYSHSLIIYDVIWSIEHEWPILFNNLLALYLSLFFLQKNYNNISNTVSNMILYLAYYISD